MHFPTLALVGSESLLGKEIRQLLRERALDAHLTLVGADEEEAGKITADGEEAAIITPLDEAQVASADILILAGSPQGSRKAWDLAVKLGSTAVVDATGVLESVHTARLRAPLVDGSAVKPAGSPVVVAHPAAVMLAMFFRQLERSGFTPARSLVEVFEPASQHGQAGIEELHQQTIRLFSFQNPPKAIFDTQLAFALLARYGVEAPLALETVEVDIERHLASLLAGGRSPMPSLRLIQAPCFHGYSISAWVEFAGDTTADALLAGMAGDGIDIRATGDDAPTNAGIAGQTDVVVGNIRADRNSSRGFWFWIVADNLRMKAENAVKLVLELCATD